MSKKIVLGIAGVALIAGGVAYGMKAKYEDVLNKVLKEKNMTAEKVECSVSGNCVLTKVEKDNVLFDKIEIYNMSDIPNVKNLKDGSVGIKITGIKSDGKYMSELIKDQIKNSKATDDAKERMLKNLGDKVSFSFSSTIKTDDRKHVSYNSELSLGNNKATGSFESSLKKDATDKDLETPEAIQKADFKISKLDIGVNIPAETVKAGIYLLYTNEIGAKEGYGYSSGRAAKMVNRKMLGENTSTIYPYSAELFKKVQANIKKQTGNSELENKLIQKLADASMKGFKINVKLTGKNGGVSLEELGQIGYKIRAYGPQYAEKAIKSKVNIDIK